MDALADEDFDTDSLDTTLDTLWVPLRRWSRSDKAGDYCQASKVFRKISRADLILFYRSRSGFDSRRSLE